jgi:putative phosphoribosyl transferase
VLNEDLSEGFQIPDRVINDVIERERQELKRREHVYRAGMPELDVDGRVVILIDDGLATGSTMRAAAQALRKQHPKRLVVAVPVGAPETCKEFRDEVDEVICGVMPDAFYAVGMWYEDFSQTTDEEVRHFLDEASHWSEMHASGQAS